MKKYTYIALLCLPFIAFSQQKKQAKTINKNGTLTFGRLGVDCNGRGICSFTHPENKDHANAIITYNEDRITAITIDRTKITKEDEVKIVGTQLKASFKAGDSLFIMEDDLELNADTRSQSQLSLPLTKIPKGTYPISITKDRFTITFKPK